MVKKKEDKGFFSGLLRDEIVPLFTNYFKKKLDEEIKSVQKAVHKRINFHVKKMYLSVTMYVGAVLLMIGFALLFEEILSLPKGSGFIIVGTIILLSSFIISTFMKK